MANLKYYLHGSRVHWCSTSTLTVLLGIALAWQEGHFDPLWALGAWVMLVSIHSALLVWDELADYKAYRAEMYAGGLQNVPTAFSAGSGVLTNGQLTYRQLSFLFVPLMGLFVAIASYATYLAGIELFFLFAFGILWGIGYGAPPFKWSYRGLGEIGLGIVCGPLITLIVYFAAVRISDPSAEFGFSERQWLFSLVPGLLAFAQTFWGQLTDLEEDTAANKRNLSVRFGTRVTLSLQVAAVVLCIVIVAFLSLRNPWLLPAIAVLLYGLRDAVWILQNRNDYDRVVDRYQRHPLYRVLAMTLAALIVGIMIEGLSAGRGSMEGAAWMLFLMAVSFCLGLRFYVPSLSAPQSSSAAS